MSKTWEVTTVEREKRAIRLTMRNISRCPLTFLMNEPSFYHVPYRERNDVTARALTSVHANPGETVVIEFLIGRDPETYRKTSRIRFTILDGAGFRMDLTVPTRA